MAIPSMLAQITQRAKLIKSMSPPTGETVIFESLKEHKQTFILLHGRGDQAHFFGEGLLGTYIPVYTSLTTAFPHAKFIFPQAPKRRCTRQPGWIMYQWFDIWGYDDTSKERENLKVEGLHQTTTMLHDLIAEEAGKIGGTKNIVLGGLSQGCAASLIALLTWSGEPLGGYMGMCGHLPFRSSLEEFTAAASEELTHKERDTQDQASRAVAWLREKLDLGIKQDAESLPFLKTPLFTGHGDVDPTVPTPFGRDAARCVKKLGASSVYHEYRNLGHWYNDAMLEDIIRFLKANADWEAVEDNP